MKTASFAKGVGVGIVIGSAAAMAVCSPSTCHPHHVKKTVTKKNIIGKALRTMGDIVENIGDSMSM